MSFKNLSFYLSSLVLVAAACSSFEKTREMKTLRVAYPNTWGSLVPALQHTLIASAIISNAFEPLVQYGEDGIFIPLACTSFEISPDFKVYKFKINTKKKFSDGSNLTSFDFKKSFEEGLKLKKISHNSSAVDALYQLEGYENFTKSGVITGIVADKPDLLELHFKTTFRQALQFMKGSRFSAVKIDSKGNYLGTGPWIIQNFNDSEKLILIPNPYYENIKKYNIEIVLEPDFIEKLKQNKIDIAEVIDSSGIDCESLKSENINCLFGDDERHVVLDLNQLNDRIFSNKNYRQAMLFLIHELFEDKKYSKSIGNVVDRIDNQFFLPFQKGRLSPKFTNQYVVYGQKYVDDLIKETKTSPILFVTSRNHVFIMEFLKSKGLFFSEKSGVYPFKDILEMGYKTNEADIISGVFSISSSDPDGLYHALGKNGGISFPMSYNSIVGNLLEEGRQLTENSEIQKKYEQINKVLFDEASTIHLGFQRQLSLYRSDHVKLLQTVLKRSDHRLEIYAPK